MLITIDVQDGLRVTEETFERLASGGGDVRLSWWTAGEAVMRPSVAPGR